MTYSGKSLHSLEKFALEIKVMKKVQKESETEKKQSRLQTERTLNFFDEKQCNGIALLFY